MSGRILETERLLLRQPERRDIPALVPLANDYDVARNLSTLPHPYTVAHGEEFVARVEEQRATGTDFNFAITRRSDDAYMGGCGVHVKQGKFEFGYWLGKPFWKLGYATEAARRLVGFAFDELETESLWAGWYFDNPASGHVLEKLGCKPDGVAKRACMARGVEVDCHLVILGRGDFLRGRAT
jgi:ribosomal-protein-alanine N-acetyltransferase